MDQEICGYLDLSFQTSNDVTFAVTLLTQLVRDIEQQITESDQVTRRNKLTEKLNMYGITSQENEVAFPWFEGETRAEIAEKLQISPNTVKFHIRNVLRKVGLKGRISFLKKFS